MKILFINIILLTIAPSILAQDDFLATGDGRAQLLGKVADGTPPPPTIKPELPLLEIEGTTVTRLADREIVLNKVQDPELPPIPNPPEQKALDFNDPEVVAWLEREMAEAPEQRIVMLSATVYDHRKSFLRWWVLNPAPGDASRFEDYEAWSNIDFNLFSGVGSYEYQGVTYNIMMGIGNQIPDEEGQDRLGYDEPESPKLPDGTPGFVITSGSPEKNEQMAFIEGLHDLYSNEKETLESAYRGRKKAEAERQAFLKANPPRPENVVIHFWRGKRTETKR